MALTDAELALFGGTPQTLTVIPSTPPVPAERLSVGQTVQVTVSAPESASVPSETQAPVSASVSDLAAVVPPDAPKNSATIPPPAKRGRPKKQLIEDQSTIPDADLLAQRALSQTQIPEPAKQTLVQGAAYELPSGQTGTFTCLTNGEQASFSVAPGKVELVPQGVEVKTLSTGAVTFLPSEPAPFSTGFAPLVVRFELGPETLAVLKALIK